LNVPLVLIIFIISFVISLVPSNIYCLTTEAIHFGTKRIVQKVFGAHFSQDFTQNRPSLYRFGWIICFNSVHVVEKQKMEWYLQENMTFFWYQNA
jgi:hypothetical protein